MDEPVPKRVSLKMTRELEQWLDATHLKIDRGTGMPYWKQLRRVLFLLQQAYPDGLDMQWEREMIRRGRRAEERGIQVQARGKIIRGQFRGRS